MAAPETGMSSNPMISNQTIGGHQVSDQVLTAVRDASRRTGTDFSYMMAKAAQESGFRPDARAATSSATGLYQFIDSTWLSMVKSHGREHGLGTYARHIVEQANGTHYVPDASMRQEILELRKNPRINALMAGEFAQANRSHLERHVGGRVGASELYLAHFLGAGGATTFLRGMRSNPDQSAAALFPQAAASNYSVFYNSDGSARSLKDVHSWVDRRMGQGMQSVTGLPEGGTAFDTIYGGVSVAGHGASDLFGADLGSRGPLAAAPGYANTVAALPGSRNLSLWTVLTVSSLALPGTAAQDGIAGEGEAPAS